MTHALAVRQRRRGFTLAEILVALMILGVIGASLVRILLVQSRFTENEMGKRNARTVSRNAMNIMLTDLRMAQDSGSLIAASSDSVTLRVPIAFGLFCNGSGNRVMSLMPVDSSMLAMGKYDGWAYRDSTTGQYTFTDAANGIPFSSVQVVDSTDCDSLSGPGIAALTVGARTGLFVKVNDQAATTPTAGWPIFIYQVVTYRFQPSTTFTGRIGLFRKLRTGSPTNPTWTSDEIIAPFASSNNFRFYMNGASATATATVPAAAALKDVRGIEINLTGASSRIPQDQTVALSKPMVTSVFFKNRRDP